MLDKLQALEDRYLDLEAKISDPEVIADQTNWLKATKAHAKLEPIVTAYREYRDMIKARDEAEELLAAGDDEELVEMAKEELKELKPQIEEYEEKLTILLLPSDPNDDKNVIVEIRGGAGGDEAALLPVFSSVCICVMQKPAAGVLRLWIPTRLSWAALRRSFSKSAVTAFTAA